MATTEVPSERHAGQRYLRKEDPRAHHRPGPVSSTHLGSRGCCGLHVVRSPFAHANIPKHIDTSKAEAAPREVAVVHR